MFFGRTALIAVSEMLIIHDRAREKAWRLTGLQYQGHDIRNDYHTPKFNEDPC